MRKLLRFFADVLLPEGPAIVPVRNAWDEATALLERGDWRGRRFLEAAERLAVIEGALVAEFFRSVDDDEGGDLLYLSFGIQDLYGSDELARHTKAPIVDRPDLLVHLEEGKHRRSSDAKGTADG